MRNLVKLGLILGLIGVLAVAKPFELDKSHTRVGFEVTHMMISSVDGNFKEFNGEIDFDPDKMLFNSLKATVDASSVNTDNKKRDDHLKAQDFFYVEKYPEISFVMTGYEPKGKNSGVMKGELTIKGITKEIELDSDINGVVIDPWGNQRVGFELDGEIDRKDFNITWNKSMDAGGLVVGDSVDLVIKVQGKATK